MDIFEQNNICIFVAGSLGRLDFGVKSDIDFFLLSKNEITNLNMLEVLGKLLAYNKKSPPQRAGYFKIFVCNSVKQSLL
jgi:hypothetical protein